MSFKKFSSAQDALRANPKPRRRASRSHRNGSG